MLILKKKKRFKNYVELNLDRNKKKNVLEKQT